MAGLLSGLGKMGLGNLENADLYDLSDDKPEAHAGAETEEPLKMQIQEDSFLFEKKYECPACYKSFTEKTVRAGKLKLVRTDQDLRPVYEQMEPLKYDVVLCPHCGYAVLAKYFGGLTASQLKAVRTEVSSGFVPQETKGSTYDFEEALNRYKLCLANAIVKRAKPSEKAYICLKAGWMLRSYEEALVVTGPEDMLLEQKLKRQEQEFLKSALEGFISARQTEDYPIAGMDEITLEYLIAVLAMEFGQDEIASRLISNILVSPSVNRRIKDKARDIKEELLARKKEKKAAEA